MILTKELQNILIVFSILFYIFIAISSVKKKVSIKYFALWSFLAIIFILMAIFPNVVKNISAIMSIREPVNLVYLVVIAFLILIIYTYSCSITKLVENNKKCIQEIGIMKKRIEDLEKKEEK